MISSRARTSLIGKAHNTHTGVQTRSKPSRPAYEKKLHRAGLSVLISASTISPTGSCLAPMDRAASRSKGLIGCAPGPR